IIGLLIAMIVLPFVALAKANSAKRGVDDLAARLESLENEVHSLRQHTVTAPKFEAAVIAVEAMPSPLPIATPIPIVQERKSEQPPIPHELAKATVSQIAATRRQTD